jgi:glutathione S-transferase
MAVELEYFALPALAEPARTVLALGDEPWKDDRFGFGDWAARKANTKWGQVPVLKVGDTQIAQSRAITRYVAKKVKVDGKPLYPEDPLEAALVDEIMELFGDIHTKMYKTMSSPAETKEADRLALVGEGGEVSALFAKLEASVGDFTVGKSLTLADIHVFWYQNFLICGFWDGLTGKSDLVWKPYPKLLAISEKVKAMPKVKEYYTKIAASEPWYVVYRDPAA